MRGPDLAIQNMRIPVILCESCCILEASSVSWISVEYKCRMTLVVFSSPGHFRASMSHSIKSQGPDSETFPHLQDSNRLKILTPGRVQKLYSSRKKSRILSPLFPANSC